MSEWITLVTQAGVPGVLALWIWFQKKDNDRDRAERLAERQANDKLRDAIQERIIKALHDSEIAIRQSTESNRDTQMVINGLKDVVIAESRK